MSLLTGFDVGVTQETIVFSDPTTRDVPDLSVYLKQYEYADWAQIIANEISYQKVK